MRRHRIAILVMISLGIVGFGRRSAHAYNGGTHHGIASLAWEVMRAANDPTFGDHIAWKGNVAPTPLSQAGTCEFCGPKGTQAAWNDFLTMIPMAMAKLNGMHAGLESVPCKETLSSDGTLKGMLYGLGTSPNASVANAPCLDPLNGGDKSLGHRLQGGAYDGRWHPGGIYDLTNPNPALDGNGYQGLALGWHAKSGDDHNDDTVLETGWVIAAVVGGVIIAALIAAGILTGAAGLGFAAGLLVVVCAAAILFCIVGIFDGDGCGNGVINGFTHLIEAAHAPITALDDNVPELDGIIPRSGDISGGTYTGMWHFINAKSSGSNSYDDRQGLYYDEAGPAFEPGQVDVMIQAGLDLGDLHIGYDESGGPRHYEISGGVDSHPDSRHRSWAKWQGPTAAHLQFAPVDNFAHYGWARFLSSHSAFDLSWPLHALADATVPMHVAGTTAWGHRPYEDSLDWAEKWNVMRFLACVPENLGDCAQSCFRDPANPSKKCPEHVDPVDNSRAQFEQARRILQHAFRWTQFVADWRSRTGNMTGMPIRDMVTQVALETFSLVPHDGDNVWPWCDDCSVDWLVYKNHNNGMDFYETDDSLKKERDLIERAVGASIGFLMGASAALPTPVACSNTTCGGTTTCCGSKTCNAGACCVAAQGSCEADADCCQGAGGSVCRNHVCQAKTGSVCQGSGHSCEDGSSSCCGDPNTGSQQCGVSRNGVNVCCRAAGVVCETMADCCSGTCSYGPDGKTKICKKLPLQSGCTADNQCDDSAVCQNDGLPVSGGAQGTCCNPATSGNLDCNSDADCCTGRCHAVGQDEFKCRCSLQTEVCSRDADCCQGTCTNGTCQVIISVCQGFRGSCQTAADCCSNGCGSDHLCLCTGTGSACTSNAGCCTGNCVNGVCGGCVAPQIDCNGQCCGADRICEGIDPNTGVAICTQVR